MAVSRETPPPPAVASGVFSSALPLVERYAELLATEGVVRGLIGPREVGRLWERHLIGCALVGRVLPSAVAVCDIGTGAGLPGIVLAIHRPDLSITLVEPLLRRTTFLAEVVAELELPQVEVVRARAEELHGEREFDVVTSRAVAPLDRLLGWSMPLVRPGGELVAMKGRSAHEEVTAARPALRKARARRVLVEEISLADLEVPTTVVRVEAPGHPRVGLPDGERSRKRPRSPHRRREA